MLPQVLADTGGHTQTQVGVNVDLADSALRRFPELIFRNTYGILQRTAVFVDDLHVFLRNRGGSVKDNRELRQPLRHFVQNVQTQLRVRAQLELISAVAGADGDGQGIHPGFLHKFLDLIRIRVHRLVMGHVHIILDAGQGPQLRFHDTAVVMGVLRHPLRCGDVLFKRQTGSIDHNGSEAAVHTGLADVEVCTVIQMHDNRNVRGFHRRLYQVHQILAGGILPCSGGSLQNQRGTEFIRRFHNTLDDLHIIYIECAHCISAVIRLTEHFCGCN